jgi:hypothetical protein
MIYLTAIVLSPVAVVQYIFTHKQYIERLVAINLVMKSYFLMRIAALLLKLITLFEELLYTELLKSKLNL